MEEERGVVVERKMGKEREEWGGDRWVEKDGRRNRKKGREEGIRRGGKRGMTERNEEK